MNDQNAQIIVGLIVLLVMAVAAVVAYIVMCAVLWRLGKKFQDDGFLAYCIPIYNYVLLCRCAKVSGWHVAAACIPVVGIGASIWTFGNIARRMGRSFWLYGLGSLLVVPVMVLAFGNAKPLAERSDPADDSPQRAAPRRYLLSCVQGEIAGARIEIPSGSIVIGRNPQKAQVILSHPHVSSSHARIRMESIPGGSRVWVEDLHSMNGTLYRRGVELGWTSLHGGETPLQGGDSIRIADGVAEFLVIED